VSGAACSWKFVTAADLYATLRPRQGHDSETTFRGYADCNLLVLDDLGAAKNSEWVEEINYRLINHRYQEKLPTIITSNLTPKTLSPGLGDRVTSRLHEMTTRVVLEGSDRRRAA
jgi:DNA replication protein DnaC